MKATRFLGLAAGLLMLPAAWGTAITWGTPTNIASATDVVTNGSLVYAYDFTGSSDLVNGITFSNFATTGTTQTVVNGNLTLTTSGGANDILNFNGFGAGATTGNYATLVGSGDYANGPIGDAQPLDVTLGGLTSGVAYEVEIWVNDSRANGLTRTESADAGPSLEFQNAGTGNGQFLIGHFTATGATQSFILQGFDTNQNHPSSATQLNGLELVQTVPEPSSLLLAGLGIGLLCVSRIRRARQ